MNRQTIGRPTGHTGGDIDRLYDLLGQLAEELELCRAESARRLTALEKGV